MLTVTKEFKDLPAAHRQPKHDGHCRLIHGHNWDFHITFKCALADENGFVLDVGKLSDIKKLLERRFDHTLLINSDDPIRMDTTQMGVLADLAEVVIVPNCGMEGLARYVFEEVNHQLSRSFSMDWNLRELRVHQVTCYEDSKNSATYSLE